VRDDLLFHYSQELTYLRYLGAEFANKYPKVAGRLLLEADVRAGSLPAAERAELVEALATGVGPADEPLLDEREESILLSFVETMDLI